MLATDGQHRSALNRDVAACQQISQTAKFLSDRVRRRELGYFPYVPAKVPKKKDANQDPVLASEVWISAGQAEERHAVGLIIEQAEQACRDWAAAA